MNFFESQDRARRQSRRLIVLFLLAVLATAGTIAACAMLAVMAGGERDAFEQGLLAGGSVLVGLMAIIGLASLWRVVQLGRGGGALAQSLGAVQVTSDTQSPRLRRLRNVVEEMAIASGVPVPEVYLLEHEGGINAFAAGFSPADAAVCVTSGALDSLSRDELQGVIAHEFSHVLNGDMRINLRLLGLLFGLLVLGVIGRHMMEARSNQKEGQAIFMAGLVVWLLGSLGLLFGRLIKASISRQREFLADASAVQFTRQTSGLAGALKKAAALPAGTKLAKGQGEEVAHMLFGDGVGFGRLFATHPPLLDRIRALEPSFNPAELGQLGALMVGKDWDSGNADEGALGVVQMLAPRTRGAVQLAPAAVVDRVGQAQDADLAHARQTRRNIAPVLKQAARSVEHAPALLFALLLDRNHAEVRQRQRALIGEQQGQAMVHRCFELDTVLQREQLDERLPLAQMCFPTLKRRPAAELRGLLATVHALVMVDGAVAVFEFCLARMLEQLLRDAEAPRQAAQPGKRALSQALSSAHEVLSVLATLSRSEAEAALAYRAGASQIPGMPAQPRQIADWRAALGPQLLLLDQLAPEAKAQLIGALTATLLQDGVLTVEESELLRVICAAMHCPLPPLLDAGLGG